MDPFTVTIVDEELTVYFKTTDVQRTWKQHGWVPPSETPEFLAKWEYFRKLDTERRSV